MKKTQVLQKFCLGSNEKAEVVHVLLRVQRKSIGFTLVLLKAQREHIGFMMCRLGSGEKQWFYIGSA